MSLNLVIVSLVVLAMGILLAALPLYSKETCEDVAAAIERFLLVGRDDSREFDEWLGIRAKDPKINHLKEQLFQLVRAHSSDSPPHYVTEAGLEELRRFVVSIREPSA